MTGAFDAEIVGTAIVLSGAKPAEAVPAVAIAAAATKLAAMTVLRNIESPFRVNELPVSPASTDAMEGADKNARNRSEFFSDRWRVVVVPLCLTVPIGTCSAPVTDKNK